LNPASTKVEDVSRCGHRRAPVVLGVDVPAGVLRGRLEGRGLEDVSRVDLDERVGERLRNLPRTRVNVETYQLHVTLAAAPDLDVRDSEGEPHSVEVLANDGLGGIAERLQSGLEIGVGLVHDGCLASV